MKTREEQETELKALQEKYRRTPALPLAFSSHRVAIPKCNNDKKNSSVSTR